MRVWNSACQLKLIQNRTANSQLSATHCLKILSFSEVQLVRTPIVIRNYFALNLNILHWWIRLKTLKSKKQISDLCLFEGCVCSSGDHLLVLETRSNIVLVHKSLVFLQKRGITMTWQDVLPITKTSWRGCGCPLRTTLLVFASKSGG